MRIRSFSAFQMLFVLLLVPMVVAAQSQSVRQIQLARNAPFPATPPASTNAAQGPEIDSALVGGDADNSDNDQPGPGIALHRTIAKGPGSPMSAKGNGAAKSNPELMLSIDALNHFQQRFVAGGGNQFSLEPPDQGLCVGNGFVLETINDVLRVFDTAGNPLTSPTALNGFYGYPYAINRTNGQFGPEISDPSCLFDTQTQRWFHVVLTLDRVASTGALIGTNHLDLAVSQTADPTGAWNVYSLPVQDDGTQGTPNHHCLLNANGDPGPCLGTIRTSAPMLTGSISQPMSTACSVRASMARRSMLFPRRNWQLVRRQLPSCNLTLPTQA